MAKIPGFGPVCTPELEAIGLDSVEKIRAIGWKEAYLRWVERFPARINLNAALGMVAADRGVHWLKVAPEDRVAAKRLVFLLRRGKRRS